MSFLRDFRFGMRYKARMSKERNAGGDATEATGTGATSGAVRLRVPDRSQVAMTVESPDDLIPPGHQARAAWAVVAAMDLSAFHGPIKARAGVGGRDATGPRLLVARWLYAAIRGVGSARELARLCLDGRAYRWLCGGVTVNHHLLSDFRVGSAQALDELFTRTIAALVKQGLVKVKRDSQDGTKVRAAAGAASFRRKATPGELLAELLAEAEAHVTALRALPDDPAKSAGWSARKKAARARAAREKVDRIGRAAAALPVPEERRRRRASKLSWTQKGKQQEPRASTTDAEAPVMKMPDGGFNPAVNVRPPVDTEGRAIVGLDVTGQGCDNGLAEPMREQVERRTGLKVEEHLVDGGYARAGQVERAAAAGVALYIPPKPPRSKKDGGRASGHDPAPGESQVPTDWRARMGSGDGRAVYKERAATSETVNADLKTHHGLGHRLPVRGLAKAKCVALWSALAYNLVHFGAALVGGA